MFMCIGYRLPGGSYGCITAGVKLVEGEARDQYYMGSHMPITATRQGDVCVIPRYAIK